MAFPVTLNGRTYTLADFQGLNYVEGFPDALEDFVTDAGAKVTAAEAAQTAAEAVFDNFDDRYLGSKTSDPTLDNDGEALVDGALYFNTTDNLIKVYDLGNTEWKNVSPTDAEQANIDTVAANISDVNTVAPAIADVSTVATNINDVQSFASVYRIESSDPATSLDEGDLVFNTTLNEVRVYNGAEWQSVAPVATSVTVSQISDFTGDVTDMNRLDITTEGESEASKVVTTDSSGDVNINGDVTATSFTGDGSSLTGVGGGFSQMEVFTSSGSWSVPSGVTLAKVTVVGGGGSGGAAFLRSHSAGGGGAGGAAIKYVSLSGGSATITIGSGGSSVSNRSNGNSGGNSSFVYSAVTLTANGGSGGGSDTVRDGGPGGTASGGDFNVTGGGGQAGNRVSQDDGPSPGMGGPSIFGGNGNSEGENAPAGQPGDMGGGGSAAGPFNFNSGSGGDGVVIIEY